MAYLPELEPTNRTALAGAGKGTPMLRVVEEREEAKGEVRSAPDEVALEGAQRMVAEALEVEVEAYLERHRKARDDDGRALVVRNGHARERRVTVGSGTLAVRAPRVNDQRVVDGERQRFTSEILPPYLRRSKAVSEVLPVLYLRGLSTGDFREGLAALLGESASGLSPSAITRLTNSWQEEYRAWRTRPLAERDYVYVWADGVHFNVRLEDERLAALVVIGARPDGTKEVVALEDGYRESTESWLSLLRDLKARGMRAPVVAVGDGALGFWNAVREVFPETREQRCWVHKTANVLNKLPKSQQSKAKRALQEIWMAETKKDALAAFDAFVETWGVKYDKAVACLIKDRDALLAFYDFPGEHWKHLRTTNVIESSFATVRHRTVRSKGCLSNKTALAMIFKLAEAAEKSWRRLDGANQLPKVILGVKFTDGIEVVRSQAQAVAA